MTPSTPACRARHPSSTAAVAFVAAASLVLAAACSASHGKTPAVSGISSPTNASTSAAPSSALSAGSSQPASSSPAASAAASSDAGSASPTIAGLAASWPTYHHDVARSGNAGPIPAITGLRIVAKAKLDAALYASPLVLHDAAGDLIIAATENNTLYGLRNDGGVAWQRHIGTPVDGSSLPCGNIDPTGITGTPVYDPASGLVFAVAFLAGAHHVLMAVDARTGALAWTRPVDPPGSHPEVEQERGALLLSGGRVWIPYGGLYGDCGPYHGYLVGVPTAGSPGDAQIYMAPSSRQAGIWTPTGAAADPAGHLYVAVGNGAQTSPQAAYDMSDSVIELDGITPVSFFAPVTWASENAADLDLGTTGPLILPHGKVFVAGKNGNAYLLNQGALGGLGGPVSTISLCTANGGAAYSDGVVFVPCDDGLHAVSINGNAMKPIWHVSPPGSPVVGGGVVLSLSSSTLLALDPASGAVKAKVGLGDSTTRFATPALSNDGFAYVGTQDGTLVVVATS
jgi:outer membrane protein assembly factor BamB